MTLSIIIPALNEADQIGRLIQYLQICLEGHEYEIIVADGGSRDATTSIADNMGATVLICGKQGRALQMNRAAKAAGGELLYFLHADSLPPRRFGDQLIRVCDAGADAGCFQMRFDDMHPLLRFYSWFTRFDIDVFKFGDQSLFVKRSLFEKIGGFDDQLLVMEDQEIVCRIRQAGARFEILDEKIVTSARKYRANGVFRLQLVFTLIFGLYYFGATQQTLVHLYKSLIRF